MLMICPHKYLSDGAGSGQGSRTRTQANSKRLHEYRYWDCSSVCMPGIIVLSPKWFENYIEPHASSDMAAAI